MRYPYMEAGTGRTYRLVKVYDPRGRYTERRTGRRYLLRKVYAAPTAGAA